MRVNKDKFVKVVKFETAVKHLSKMVQKEDGEIFSVSYVIDHYEQGLKEFENLEKETRWNGEKLYDNYELLQESYHESTDEYMTTNTHIHPGNYHYYWRMSDGCFCRINVEFHEGIGWYIDCGMADEEAIEEEKAFEQLATEIKTTLNIDVEIKIDDHPANYKGTSHINALGLCIYEPDEDKYTITIDQYYVHEWYRYVVKNDITFMAYKFEDCIEKTICHELAHVAYFKHGKKHTDLTETYYQAWVNKVQIPVQHTQIPVQNAHKTVKVASSTKSTELSQCHTCAHKEKSLVFGGQGCVECQLDLFPEFKCNSRCEDCKELETCEYTEVNDSCSTCHYRHTGTCEKDRLCVYFKKYNPTTTGIGQYELYHMNVSTCNRLGIIDTGTIDKIFSILQKETYVQLLISNLKKVPYEELIYLLKPLKFVILNEIKKYMVSLIDEQMKLLK